MASPFNKAIEIIEDMREGAGLPTMLHTIKRALEASLDAGRFSSRTAEKLIPVLRAAARHPQSPQKDKIKLTECVSMIQAGATPEAVLDIFHEDGARLQAAKKLSQPESLTAEAAPQDNTPVAASQSGLYGEAQAFTRSRGPEAVFSVEDVLHAMDHRFPYATPSS